MKISLKECLQSDMILDWRSGTDVEAIPFLALNFEKPDDGEEWSWITLGDVQVVVQCGEAGNKVFDCYIYPGHSGAGTIKGCRGFSIFADGLRPRMPIGEFTAWCVENAISFTYDASRDLRPYSLYLKIGANGLADTCFRLMDGRIELEKIHLASGR